MFSILNLIMNSRHCKSKRIKRKWEKTKEHSKKGLGVCGVGYSLYFIRDWNWRNLTFWWLMESWSEIASWLSCCLQGLLTIICLAADLAHQDCIIPGRVAKVHSLSTKTVWSLLSFWSGTPLPASPLHRKAKADLFCGSFIGLAIYWSLVSQLLPPHLSDVFLRKSLKTLETTYK